jgi:hypothetical protein
MHGALRPRARGIDRVGRAVDDVVVDGVLRMGARVGRAKQPLVIGLVLAEQQLRRGVGGQPPLAELGVRGAHAGAVDLQRRPRARVAPRPGVAEPQRRQQVERGRLGPAVVRGDEHQQVVGPGLGVLDDHVEVAVVLKDTRIEQLVLEVLLAATSVRGDEIVIGERPLRVLVQALQIRMRGRAVQVEPVLLGVLAVVAATVGQPEDTLLKDRVRPVPQRQREAHPLTLVADPRDAVLTPPVGARPRLVMREVVPRVPVPAVVLTDRPPLTLGHVRAPRLPRDLARARLLQPHVLRSPRRAHARQRTRIHGSGTSPRAGELAMIHSRGMRRGHPRRTQNNVDGGIAMRRGNDGRRA